MAAAGDRDQSGGCGGGHAQGVDDDRLHGLAGLAPGEIGPLKEGGQ
jgi:hypothetical protein